MATPFDRLMTTIVPYLPGAIEQAIKQELYLVCDDFFQRSDVWQDKLDFTVPGDTTVGEITPYTGRIVRLLHVTHDDRFIRGVTLGDIDISGSVQINLPFPATHTYDYVATVSMTVSDPTTRDAFPIVPNELVTRYTSALMHGVLSRMLAQPSKPYTNLQLAQYHLLKFKGETARAKNEVKAGKTAGSQAWTFPQTMTRRA